jgi:uncharacterized RDD family membrane protein YckC
MKPTTFSQFRRILAFLIDYIVIATYGVLLFLINVRFNEIYSHFEKISHPIQAQLIGFLTLSLPVVLYFTLFENSARLGTPGKWLLNLKVVSTDFEKTPFHCLAIRNAIKFLPWEMAHICIHWGFYYMNMGKGLPAWFYLGNGLSMAMAALFVIWIFTDSENRTFYEKWSGTRVTYVA